MVLFFIQLILEYIKQIPPDILRVSTHLNMPGLLKFVSSDAIQGRGESSRKRPVGQREQRKRKQQQERREREREATEVSQFEEAELIVEAAPATNIPLGRLDVAASNRQSRRFQGFVGAAQVKKNAKIHIITNQTLTSSYPLNKIITHQITNN